MKQRTARPANTRLERAQEMSRRGSASATKIQGGITVSNDYIADISQKIAQLPVSMQVKDVADFLGIARATAYKLVQSPSFPTVNMPGIKRIVVPKQKFLEWYFSENIQIEQSQEK